MSARPFVALLIAAGCGGTPRQPPSAPVAAPPATVASAPAPAPASSEPPAKPSPDAGGPEEAVVIQRFASAPPSPCQESPLPPAYRSPAPAVGPNLGRGLAIGLPPETVLAGRVGGDELVVYRSYRLEPSSELGDAGYRVALKRANAQLVDVSLGFSEMRPYVLVADTRLPLLQGDTLQLRADVREIDDKSITFPPVALHAKREKKDLLLTCPLSALTRDGDGDGLTDLEESRLGTDAGDGDTDGDGIRDGDDPAPLGAAKPQTPEQEVWVAAMEQVVSKKVGDELLLAEADGPRLGLSGVKLRVLELTKKELEAYRDRFGMHVTFGLDIKMQGPDDAKVGISFGWTGGEWDAHRGPGGWSFRGGAMWVTQAPRDDGGAVAGR